MRLFSYTKGGSHYFIDRANIYYSAKKNGREFYSGEVDKEMVNEYRGIKVRFLPSICPNDEWHKQMGYEAKRTGQAYIWNKQRGLEGYLQTNVRI